MPLSHRKIAAVYLQLAQQLGAGLTIAQALGMPSAIPVRERRRLVALIEQGHPLDVVIDSADDWLPDEDRAFLAAAAQTGRLPLILHELSERHDHLAKLQMRVLMACLYPAFVLHFGAVVFAFFRLIDWEKGLLWDTPRFVTGIAMILGPVWGGAVLLRLGITLRLAPARWLLNALPAVGGYRRNQALADFAFALGQLLSAGAPIASAWACAGEIANSPRIARAARAIDRNIVARESPGAHLGEHSVFPPDFVAGYLTGEHTGSLDQSLLKLAEVYQERAHTKLKVAAFAYPMLLFFAVAGMVLYIVVSFYAGYLNSILKMIG